MKASAAATASARMAGAAALLGGTGVATAHAEPGVTVAPGGGRYYGDQGDGNGLAYLAELRDVGLTGGTPVGAAATAVSQHVSPSATKMRDWGPG
jgi:hypothetical protein